MTALAPLVSHHDVTWIASALSDEDRAVAAEGAVEETARDGSRYRLRLVAHPPSAYDLYYNVVANPALWFVQHGLWALKHDPGPRPRLRLGGGIRGGEPGLCGRRARGARARAGSDGLLPRLPPLRRARARPGAAARRRAGPLHPHSLGGRRGLVGASRPDRDRRFTPGLLANDVVGFHTERWRSAFLSACSSLGPRRGRARSSPRIRSRSIRTSSTELARSERGARAGARAGRLPARDDDPPGRPHRSVEEHRARASRRSGCCSSAGRTCAAASACWRCSTPRARRSPSTSRSCAASRRRRRPSRNASPARSTLRVVRRLPAVDRGVQAVRRAARERRHGRAQPRREGGAARQHARRCCCLICKRRRARGARRMDGLDRPVRRRGPGRGARGGARAAAATSAAPGWRRSASTCARTTWRRGSRPSWPTSTARVRCGGCERPLARRRVRLRAHGRRRREADVAAPGGRARFGADGGRDRAAPRLAAEGRRARDRAARRDHGREADERPDPALPPAAAFASSTSRSRSSPAASRSPPRPRRPRRRASRWRRSSPRRSPR